MKICPVCRQQYNDVDLNFCLSDGTALIQEEKNIPPPPTIYMDSPRNTNPQFDFPNQTANAPLNEWQNAPLSYPQNSGLPLSSYGMDKTIPTISLILSIVGLIGFCCYLGIPLGLAAVILGYLGIKNVGENPTKYGGKGMAIAGTIIGIIAFLLNFLMIVFGLISSIGR